MINGKKNPLKLMVSFYSPLLLLLFLHFFFFLISLTFLLFLLLLYLQLVGRYADPSVGGIARAKETALEADPHFGKFYDKIELTIRKVSVFIVSSLRECGS